MAIGRTEDRDTPQNPLMLRHRVYVQDPIRATHLGQRSPTAHTGRTHDRNRPDPSRQLHKILATRGPSTHGFRARRCAAPRNDGIFCGFCAKPPFAAIQQRIFACNSLLPCSEHHWIPPPRGGFALPKPSRGELTHTIVAILASLCWQ